MKDLKPLNRFLLPVILITLSYNCKSQLKNKFSTMITKSEIRLTDEGYRMFLNGEPFYVKGAGVDVVKGDLEALAYHGANSIRTWSTDNGREVLDKAHVLGLKVMMGIWVGLERHGFNYNDKAAVKKQLESIRKQVVELKDHPALMAWGIGNELNLLSKNPKVWDALDQISKMIHKVDPNHVTTTMLSDMTKKDVDLVMERAPDIDFLSVQMYAGIEALPELIAKSNYKGPLMITEWGATGYWEVATTEWGAPIENNSSVKADLYLSRYENSILAQKQQVMGSYVFYWGQKQERTPTWFGMFMPDGNETEAVDAMHYAWNDEWPKNRSPRLNGFTLEGQQASDNIKLKVGKLYSAQVNSTDPDKDKLMYHWEIMRESTSTNTGGDAEYIPRVMKELFPENGDRGATFNAPSTTGAYRLFIYVKDGNGHTAHANIPFWVEE